MKQIPASVAEANALARQGFAFVPAASMRGLLGISAPGRDWDAFAASWNDLPWDEYLARYGRYRRRRHAVFYAVRGGSAEPAPRPEPHYQSRAYNPLQGGIERWFEPIDAAVGSGNAMRSILRFCRGLFDALAPAVTRWRIEAHQFRIEARADLPGQPTPEGMHRDGVDYVLVLLIARTNIASGTTMIHAPDRRELGSFTLIEPLDAALVDDARVFHGVTPVAAVDPAQPAHRDVLVVTFKRVD
ncbi:MAG TPA: 2OG-Fe dioxygenase family protein [Rudaea sp.]|nr:2OG-Fe dioxygenase family protein [Rudaea sp.]